MVDSGLIGSILVVLGCLYAAARWAPIGSMHPNEAVDRLYLPTFAAVAAGRFAAAALDDPTSLRSLRSMLILRGGVEFWPGLIIGTAALIIGLRRADRPVLVDLVELTPFALWGYGAWEATCLLRDGCFGPRMRIGPTPPGLAHPQMPVGLLVGAAVVGLGLYVRHAWAIGPTRRLLAALAGLAAIRAVSSIWLPHLGDSFTRQHWQSIFVAVVAGGWLGLATMRAASARHVPEIDPDADLHPRQPAPPMEQIRPQRVFRHGPIHPPRTGADDETSRT